MAELKRLLTMKEVCDWLGFTEQTVKKFVRSGKLPGGKVGGRWRFDPEALTEWIKNRK